MKRIISAIVFVAIALGPSIVSNESAQAITCAQRDMLLAQALSAGDISAAATYRNMSCTSGTTSGGTTLTCAQRQLNISAALSRGDAASAAYWSAASCISSGSSGSSGGSSGGGSANPPAAAPSCSGGPDAPDLKVTQLVTGVKFDVTPAKSGQTLVDMQYNYTLYDSSTNTWSPWTSWSSMGTSAFSKTITQSSADTTRVGFGVYSRNSCGTSAIIRESSDNKGLLLVNPAHNFLLLESRIPSSVPLAQSSFELGPLVSGSLGGAIDMSSDTPGVCEIDGSSVVLLKIGICRITAATQGSETALADSDVVTIAVLPAKSTITCVNKAKRSVKKRVTGVNPKCPSGFVKT